VPAEIRNQQEMIRLVWKRYGTGKSIGIFRVTNMPNTCLVILAGTEPLKPLIQNTHFLEDLKAGLSLGDPFRDSILRALGSSRGQSVCPRGSRLILAGHSLGGMEGQLVATDPRLREAGYSAMSVITFGAPKVADEAYETDDDGKIVRLTLYRRFSAIGDSIPESTRALDFVRHYQDAGSTFVDDRPPRDRDAALRFATEDLEDLKKDPVGLLTFLAAGVPAHMSYPCIAELAQYDGLGVRRTAPVTLRLGREAYFFSPRVVHLTD
jgi:pimeloyl-ACP methyl ester carboxylesterase